MSEITNILFENQDKKYKDFQVNIINNIDKDTIIGVRTPFLRSFAKELIKNNKYVDFLNELPHKYFDENQLHTFIISELKKYDECIEYIKAFLPYIDNWATCDQLSPKIFKKNLDKLKPFLNSILYNDHIYTSRFAIGMYMQHYLDEDFDIEYIEKISKIKSEEYYLNMMIAWYFATALAKQWNSAIKYIENNSLSVWVHNKTIQKAIESFRITEEQKLYLRSLKRK